MPSVLILGNCSYPSVLNFYLLFIIKNIRYDLTKDTPESLMFQSFRTKNILLFDSLLELKIEYILSYDVLNPTRVTC